MVNSEFTLNLLNGKSLAVLLLVNIQYICHCSFTTSKFAADNKLRSHWSKLMDMAIVCKLVVLVLLNYIKTFGLS